MAIRISGMISGLDTDSLVQELVSAYSLKKQKTEKAQTKHEWKQEAWKELNTKIYNLYSKTISDLRYSTAYSKKKTTVSDATKATVVAGNSSVIGNQTLEVTSLAKAGYMTGGKISATDTSARLSTLGIEASSFNVNVGGEETTIDLTPDMTIGDVVSKLKATGLTASYDTTNQRFFVSSASSGAENNFTITANTEKGISALSSLGLFSASKADREEYEKWAAYTTDDVNNMVSSYNTELLAGRDQRVEDAIAAREKNLLASYKSDKEAVSSIKKEIEELKTHRDDDTLTDDDRTAIDKKIVEKEEALKKAEEKFADYTGKVDVTQDADGNDVLSVNAGYKAAEDLVTAQEVDDAIQTETEAYRNYVEDKVSSSAQALVEIGNMDSITDKTSLATKIDGADATIVLNGATFHSSSNSFTINGLTITANALTDSEITLTTDTDVDQVYDTIKNFIKGYNELINEMDSLYNATSSKGYEPLTSEEKEAMSEEDIKKWESKIKDSLLRRDNTLSSVSTAMKTAMQAVYEVNGQRMSLSTFGIATGEYLSTSDNEKGAYHIDGDADDSTTSSKKDRLKTAIATNPEDVMSFFSQLTTGLYDTLTEKMKSTTMSSAFTVYNDKQMQTELNDYKTKVKEWESYLKEQEEYWYSKFSAMETALSKMQSSQSALAGLLGS